MTERMALQQALDAFRRANTCAPFLFRGRVLHRLRASHYGGGACLQAPIYFLGLPVRPSEGSAAFCIACHTRLYWERDCAGRLVLVPGTYTHMDIMKAAGCPEEGVA
jgi:hypothetical protein